MRGRKLSTKRGMILEVLNELETNRGYIDTQEVVDIARDKKSILHDSFEWDDKVGGEKYRKMQARLLIKEIKVQVIDEKKKAFYSIKIENPAKATDRKYFSRPTVQSTPAMQEQLMYTALKQLKTWVETYRELEDLSGIVNEEELNKLLAR